MMQTSLCEQLGGDMGAPERSDWTRLLIMQLPLTAGEACEAVKSPLVANEPPQNELAALIPRGYMRPLALRRGTLRLETKGRAA